MLQKILLYLGTFGVFLVIDFIWLTFVAKDLYKENIGHLMAANPNLIAALLFYLLYIGGVLYLAVLPAIQTGDIKEAIFRGAVFGFLAYATYDLTNLATLKDWPVKITIIDLIWGTSLSTTVAVAGFYIAKALKIG